MAMKKLRRAARRIEKDFDEEKGDDNRRNNRDDDRRRGRGRGRGRGRDRGRDRGKGKGNRSRNLSRQVSKQRKRPSLSRLASKASQPSLSRLQSKQSQDSKPDMSRFGSQSIASRPTSREKWKLAAIKTQYRMIVNTLASTQKTKSEQIQAQEEQLAAQDRIIAQLKKAKTNLKSVDESQLNAVNAKLKFVNAENEELSDKIKKLEKDLTYAKGHIDRLQKENDANTDKHTSECERNQKLVDKNNLMNEKINLMKAMAVDEIIQKCIANPDQSDYHLQMEKYDRSDQEKLVCLLSNYQRLMHENEVYSRQIFAMERQSATVCQKLSELELVHQGMRDKFRKSENRNLESINELQNGLAKWKTTAECFEQQLKKIDDDLYFHCVVFENIRKRIAEHVHKEVITKPNSNRLALPAIGSGVKNGVSPQSKSAEFEFEHKGMRMIPPINFYNREDVRMNMSVDESARTPKMIRVKNDNGREINNQWMQSLRGTN